MKKPAIEPYLRYNLNRSLRKGNFVVITSSRTVVVSDMESLSKINKKRIEKAKVLQYNIVKELF